MENVETSCHMIDSLAKQSYEQKAHIFCFLECYEGEQ
jgi:hypothetical protein